MKYSATSWRWARGTLCPPAFSFFAKKRKLQQREKCLLLLLFFLYTGFLFAQSYNEEEETPHNHGVQTAISLQDPDNATYSLEYDQATGLVTAYRKIGGVNVELPYSMSMEEYQNQKIQQSMADYWQEKERIQNGRGDGEGTPEEQERNSLLNSKWKVKSELFSTIFGSDQITMKLQGQAKVDIGIQYYKIDNPTMQERYRATTSFDFDESVQINFQSKIGEKLGLTINYNTEATFDFENEVKLEYTGNEDDIIQNIEVGNISWNLPGTLIQGSQSLFGFKMDMKFGKLGMETVFSQKRGESNTITVQNGSMNQEFDIDVTDYDKNRHFFLSHKFKEMYDDALKSLPNVISQITITKIEVWVTNKSGASDATRNIVAFVDMGETGDNLQNSNLWRGTSGAYPSNDANNLYSAMTSTYAAARNISGVTQTMNSISNFKSGRDYEKLENARMLSSSEYTLNEKLGYISLNTALNNNEVLCVAYQYTYRGQTYKVGEFSSSGIDAPQCLYLKLLKGTTLTSSYKNWDLMMKNIYSLGASDVQSENFDCNVVYLNDSTSTYINYFNEGTKSSAGGLNGLTWLQVMGLDNLNGNLDKSADGKWDFVDGYTVNAYRGLIIFPQREPFGSFIEDKLSNQPALAKKYAFTAIYDSTQTYAKQQTSKNKYKIRGSYESKTSNDISLGAFNIAEGSVVVTAGGQVLTENLDYSVDYNMGRVRILNTAILNSGNAINISYEDQSSLNTQTQTMLGVHLNYEFNENINVGATVIHMNEKPLTKKVSYGDESISNTMLGSDVSFSYPLPFLTKGIDWLPLITTDAESRITVEAEIAKLIAGHSKSINAAYIDDFESSTTTYNLASWTSWKIASKPTGHFSNGGVIDDLSVGFDRALIAWYTIDPLFLRNTTTTPTHIRRNPETQSSHYVREVYEEELYPNKESAYGESTNISVLNVAYYPNERGSYNLTTDIDKDGFLNNPADNWGGIQRKLDYTDFDAQNIEYIQFWMLDPFIYNRDRANVGGDLYFDVGYISEDVLPDGRKSFENGLPTPNDVETQIDSTTWAYVPQTASVTNAFNTDPASMYAQDAGLNGMSSDKERYFYNKASYPYMDMIQNMYNNGEITQTVYDQIYSDPANDDFHYYRGSDYDAQEVGILDRYKRFNMTEGNSRPSEYSTESYTTAAYSTPDNEDLNDDYTLNESESYYEYHISLRPDSMVVGQNYIADMMTTTVKLKNGNTESVNWYQFKIPLAAPDSQVGDIGDMSSMQFLRMYMTNFTDTCILRFATLELVKGQWRQYTEDLWEDGANPSAATQFETSVVNIEEDDRRSPVNYVLPPDIDRVVDPSNPQLRQLNEQSYTLKVIDLGNADARAVYKTLDMDFRNYKRLKMFVHAEAVEGYPLEDDQMTLFVRLGTDYVDNYYEYEIPLKLTPYGIYNDGNESDRYIVWPEENELNVPFTAFTKCKLARNEAKSATGSGLTLQDVYSTTDPDNVNNIVSIKGNPSLGNVVTMMIGVRSRGAGVHSAEVWVNELRLTEFDEDGGWATRARATLQLADLGTIAAAGQYSSVGFGSIDQSVLERSMYENTDFDISGSFELAKIVSPRARWSIPFYLSYSKSIAKPKYSPYDTDIELSTVLDMCDSKEERDSIIHISETIEETKSLNFMNVRYKPQAGKRTRVWSPSNWSASYSFTETTLTDPDTEYDIWRDIMGNISYNYAAAPKPVEPLKKSKLNEKYFGLLKSFNFYWQPTLISYRWEMVRSYEETQMRNVTNPDYIVPLSVSKDWNWNRYFDFKFNLSRGLRFTLTSATTARIDEPEGAVNKDLYPEEYKIWKDSIWTNIWHFGRKTQYEHSGDLAWTIPINKLPYLDFLSATAQYKGSFLWVAEALNSDYEWGNTIENGNTKMYSAMSNFGTLYNKSAYLKKIYDKYNFSSSNRKKKQNSESQTVRYTQRNLTFEKNKEITIKHNLATTDVSARAYDDRGRGIKGTLVAIDANSAVFTPTMDGDNGRVVVTGIIHEETSPGEVIRDVFMILLTSFKTISVSYTENNGTVLPGYLPGEKFAGFADGWNYAPGAGFVCGFQDRDFAMKAINKGWVTNDTTLNEPYMMNKSKNLQFRATFEIFKALKVDLNMQRTHDNSMSEYYLFNANGFDNVYNTINTGSFSMTICPIKTSGHRPSKTGSMGLDLYDRFLDNRQIISQRMGETRMLNPEYDRGEDIYADGYGTTSQEVLIPAFLSAYTGGDANDVFLRFIPKTFQMRPNWNVTFSGLNNIKALQNIARNIEFSHAYTSKYSIGGYETSLDWVDDGNAISWVRDLANNFVPEFEASSVSITEQFSPFLAISATWINNLTTTVSTGKNRTITLGLASNQVTETYGTDWSFNVGYRFDNINFVMGKNNVNNDLNLTFGFSVRDSYTILRRVEELSNELTSGTRSTSINFSADYQFTQAFSMGFYYDQTLAHPYISTSYPTNNINVGFSFQLSLSQ